MGFDFLYSELTVLLILACITLAAVWLDANIKVLKKLGTAVIAILLGLILSNTGVLPDESSVYIFFAGDGILAGIILILLKVNLATIRDAGLPMIKAFFIGAFGSALGALVMGYLLFPQIGEETWKLSGQFAATYIGGGMNYAAIGRELGTSSELFSAGIAADVIITAVWLVVCIAVPGMLDRYRKTPPKMEDDLIEPDQVDNNHNSLDKLLFKSAGPITLNDIALLAIIVVGTLWISKLLAMMLPIIPMIIWLTTIILLIAQIPKVKLISGGTVIGNYLIILFLATNGARSVIAKIIDFGPSILYFALGTVFIHGVIIFGIGRLMKIEYSTLSVASQANIGGGASAMAIAGARGYTSLILSGVAVGIMGNAIGNYIGLLIANLLKFFI